MSTNIRDSQQARPAVRSIIKRIARLPLAHRLRLVWLLAGDPRIPARARIPVIVLLLYLAMPLDIVPDFIPVLGQLDDLLVAGIAVWWFLRVCPPAPVLDAIERLEQRPLHGRDRFVPWIVGGAAAVSGIAAGAWLVASR